MYKNGKETKTWPHCSNEKCRQKGEHDRHVEQRIFLPRRGNPQVFRPCSIIYAA